MTLTFPTFSLANLLTPLRRPTVSDRSPLSTPMTEADESRASRDYLHDMTSRFPEALQSEGDVMLLMKLYTMQF